MADNLKVSIGIAWLSENALLERAAALLGMKLKSTSDTGAVFTCEAGRVATTSGTRKALEEFSTSWDGYSFEFTIAQLIELGFELGDLKYCPHCKRLQAVCDQEQEPRRR